MKSHVSRFIGILVLITMLPIMGFATNSKPFVIPELKEWKGAKGEFKVNEHSRIIIPTKNEALRKIADQFSDEIDLMFGVRLEVVIGKARKGDIAFGLKKNKALGKEGYTITISDRVVVSAPEAIGAFWATRTLLQIAEQSEENALPQGFIKDFPDFALRGFMIDAGRKFIPMSNLDEYVKLMAYYKMNTLQVHLNDNGFKQFFQEDFKKTYSAFRLESETFPELTAQDGFYTKQEFKDFQDRAEANYVTIIPEIDVPAHSLAFTQYMPEIGSDEYGMDHLDLFKPETYSFLDALFKEYLEGDDPVFKGKLVHVGTDEYSNKDQAVVEKFRYFTDYCIKLVESYGKEAAIWGALTHAQGETPVKSDNVLLFAWHNNYAQPDDMLKLGYDIVSIPDGLLYIVPNAGYYYDFLNHKYLYEKWTPNVVAQKTVSYNEPKLKGGMFAVWNDHVGNGVTTKDIYVRVFPAVQTLATKMWTGKSISLSWDEFNKSRLLLSEAPGLNARGFYGTEHKVIYKKSVVKANEIGKLEEVGYNYTVSFDIEGAVEDRGTILFSSDFANFYLSDPTKGLLGFLRDGYLDTFNYRIKPGKTVNIMIEGDAKGTRLYVDGRLVEDKTPESIYYKNGEKYAKLSYLSTLFFPLKETGDFKSTVKNLKVYNYHKMKK